MKEITFEQAMTKLAETGFKVKFKPEDVANIVTDHFPGGLPLRKGWFQKMWVSGDGIQFRDYNPMLVGKGVPEAFFVVQNGTHLFGAPQFDEEPSLAIPRDDLEGHHIIGVIVEDENGEVKIGSDGKPMRFSWLNLTNQGREFSIANGEFFLDGVSQGFIQVLYTSNKNRIRPEYGWVAGVGPERVEEIRIKEMEDVSLTKL